MYHQISRKQEGVSSSAAKSASSKTTIINHAIQQQMALQLCTSVLCISHVGSFGAHEAICDMSRPANVRRLMPKLCSPLPMSKLFSPSCATTCVQLEHHLQNALHLCISPLQCHASLQIQAASGVFVALPVSLVLVGPD